MKFEDSEFDKNKNQPQDVSRLRFPSAGLLQIESNQTPEILEIKGLRQDQIIKALECLDFKLTENALTHILDCLRDKSQIDLGFLRYASSDESPLKVSQIQTYDLDPDSDLNPTSLALITDNPDELLEIRIQTGKAGLDIFICFSDEEPASSNWDITRNLLRDLLDQELESYICASYVLNELDCDKNKQVSHMNSVRGVQSFKSEKVYLLTAPILEGDESFEIFEYRPEDDLRVDLKSSFQERWIPDSLQLSGISSREMKAILELLECKDLSMLYDERFIEHGLMVASNQVPLDFEMLERVSKNLNAPIKLRLKSRILLGDDDLDDHEQEYAFAGEDYGENSEDLKDAAFENYIPSVEEAESGLIDDEDELEYSLENSFAARENEDSFEEMYIRLTLESFRTALGETKIFLKSAPEWDEYSNEFNFETDATPRDMSIPAIEIKWTPKIPENHAAFACRSLWYKMRQVFSILGYEDLQKEIEEAVKSEDIEDDLECGNKFYVSKEKLILQMQYEPPQSRKAGPKS